MYYSMETLCFRDSESDERKPHTQNRYKLIVAFLQPALS